MIIYENLRSFSQIQFCKNRENQLVFKLYSRFKTKSVIIKVSKLLNKLNVSSSLSYLIMLVYNYLGVLPHHIIFRTSAIINSLWILSYFFKKYMIYGRRVESRTIYIYIYIYIDRHVS